MGGEKGDGPVAAVSYWTNDSGALHGLQCMRTSMGQVGMLKQWLQ
jgi:hypothetical protein